MSTDASSASAPPARSSDSSPAVASKSKRSPLTVTGIHVLKSALLTVLGQQCVQTKSTDFTHATKATLTVSYEGGQAIAQELADQIDAKANELIQANLLTAELPLLPGTDLAALDGAHTERTGELKVFKLVKKNNQKNQSAYEFIFVVHTAAEELIKKNAAAVAATNSKKTSSQQQAAVAASSTGEKKGKSSSSASASSAPAAVKVANRDYITEATQSLFNDIILPEIAKLQSAASGSATPAASLTPAELTALKSTLYPQLESYLTMFSNQAYTKGALATKAGTGNIDLARLL